MRARAPIDDVQLEARKKRYEDERSFMHEADYVIENPDGGLDAAKEKFVQIVGELRG